MRLKWPEAEKRMATPIGLSALLICGDDPMKVAIKRQDALFLLGGPTAEADMRITRLPAAALRSDGALLVDTIKEVGFFPGQRIAFVEDATDGLTETIAQALREWKPGDAFVLITAGNLTAKSALRSLIEKHPAAGIVILYDDPPTREEIDAELRKAGLVQIDPPAMNDLAVLARSLDPGDFRQTLEKISLYKFGDPSPLTTAEVAAMAPGTIETELDTLIHAVANARVQDIGPLMLRLTSQGTQPVGICIAALRHFRILHAAAADPSGIAGALDRARVNFKAKEAMERQAKHWGRARLEAAVCLLLDTDLALRSSTKTPVHALLERSLIRLAMMPR